jgi:hypothetical protein
MKTNWLWIAAGIGMLLYFFYPGEKKEVSIVQQYSPVMNEWHNVILVFGFMDNEAEAENVKSSYEKIAPGRVYRVHQMQVSSKELKKFQLFQK